jgi:2,4-dichlorophenol 6-monooxygenase
MRREQTPVLIAGGGGAGLTASMLLARMGQEHLLVSARPGTSDLPKAHVLNQRAMEILEDAGAAEEIARRGTPAANMAATAFYAGFAGPGEEYGRVLARLECWGAGGQDENWSSASAWVQQNLPQIRLEPILRARAEELSPGRVRFHHELLSLTQDEDGATALVRDHGAGEDYEVRCEYVIGADGGRRVAGEIGVTYEGLGVVSHAATLHVSADFSKWARDPDVLIRWIFSPQAGVGVVMVPMGPERWGPDSEEWVIHLNAPVDAPDWGSDGEVEAAARLAMGIGEHPMEIHKVTRWAVDAVIASAFSVGRVHLVGDAAHRHPPTGGLGLTSAIHDVNNLCWKLVAVLDGHAGPELLATYEPERRPADEQNVQRSLENAINHLTIANAVGVSHENSEQQNLAALAVVAGRDGGDPARRSAALREMRAQSMEFLEHNVELGYRYESAAVIPDGTPEPASPDAVRVYAPSTRPGAPLPHAWIDDEDGARRPVKDLVAPGRFLLIAGEDGEAWCEAARELAGEVPLDAVRIGHLDGDLFDPRCTWLRRREIGPEGAILVRPDRYVAWRSLGAVEAPREELAGALGAILARSVGEPVVA